MCHFSLSAWYVVYTICRKKNHKLKATLRITIQLIVIVYFTLTANSISKFPIVISCIDPFGCAPLRLANGWAGFGALSLNG